MYTRSDRHLDNLMMDTKTGGILQIDFGICFGMGSSGTVPTYIHTYIHTYIRIPSYLLPLYDTYLHLRTYMFIFNQVLPVPEFIPFRLTAQLRGILQVLLPYMVIHRKHVSCYVHTTTSMLNHMQLLRLRVLVSLKNIISTATIVAF